MTVGWAWGSLLQRCPLPPSPGITVQGPVSLDLLQLSSESLHWHNYSDILPPVKVLATWVPWASDPPCPIVGSTVFVPKASSHLRAIPCIRGCEPLSVAGLVLHGAWGLGATVKGAGETAWLRWRAGV